MENLKNLNKEYKFDDNLGWLKFDFQTKSWWFYLNDGMSHDTGIFDINEAIYKIQLTKSVLAEIDGYTENGKPLEQETE
jgi:hypothetical protein